MKKSMISTFKSLFKKSILTCLLFISLLLLFSPMAFLAIFSYILLHYGLSPFTRHENFFTVDQLPNRSEEPLIWRNSWAGVEDHG